MTVIVRYFLVLAVVLIAQGPAAAGSLAEGEPQFSGDQIARLAKKVEREIAARGARVALISRVGRSRDELPDGIEFTHVGFAVYSRITTMDGRVLPGYAIYNLYQDNDKPDSSFLLQDYALDYYRAVYELRAGVIIPKPELQRRLLRVIHSDTYAELHNPQYSAISNPFNTEYQNCTEFVLDVLNAAIYETGDQRQIKANEAAYFDPQSVHVNSLRLWLGSVFKADIFITDHPGPVRTATFGSISRYMLHHDIADEVFTVSVD